MRWSEFAARPRSPGRSSDTRTVTAPTPAPARPSSTVVFVHGWGASPDVYGETLRLLRKQHDVLTPVLPGHAGRKPIALPRKDVLAGLADDLVAGLPGDLSGVTMIGHSLGAGVAIRVAVQYPGLVSRLVLACPVGGDGDLSPRGFARLIRGSAHEFRVGGRRAPVARGSMKVMLRLARHPVFAARLGLAAKGSRLAEDLAVLTRRGVGVSVFTAVDDHVTVPLPVVSGVNFEYGPGRHAWPVEEPVKFAAWLESRLEAAKEHLDFRLGERVTVSESFA